VLLSSFLNLYGAEEGKCISLDEAASSLGVERRRIYDIVNVLESIEVCWSSVKCPKLVCLSLMDLNIMRLDDNLGRYW